MAFPLRRSVAFLCFLLAAACGADPRAAEIVGSVLSPTNKPGIGRSDLAVKKNPRGEGAIVYSRRTQRAFNTERQFVWFVLDDRAFAINGPAKGVTPALLFFREAPDALVKRSGFSAMNVADFLAVAYGD